MAAYLELSLMASFSSILGKGSSSGRGVIAIWLNPTKNFPPIVPLCSPSAR